MPTSTPKASHGNRRRNSSANVRRGPPLGRNRPDQCRSASLPTAKPASTAGSPANLHRTNSLAISTSTTPIARSWPSTAATITASVLRSSLARCASSGLCSKILPWRRRRPCASPPTSCRSPARPNSWRSTRRARAVGGMVPASASATATAPSPTLESRSASTAFYMRYREGQEDQLSALGLTVNLVVLWNTIYMDASLNQLTSEGYEVRPEDVARLSPLGLKHINMLGRYAFTLPDFVARGELRPLRDPRMARVDEATDLR